MSHDASQPDGSPKRHLRVVGKAEQSTMQPAETWVGLTLSDFERHARSFLAFEASAATGVAASSLEGEKMARTATQPLVSDLDSLRQHQPPLPSQATDSDATTTPFKMKRVRTPEDRTQAAVSLFPTKTKPITAIATRRGGGTSVIIKKNGAPPDSFE